MLSCSQCGSTNLKRSRARGVERPFKRWTSYRAYRCSDCKWRGWLPTGENPWRGIFKKFGQALGFLTILLFFVVVAWLIARALS